MERFSQQILAARLLAVATEQLASSINALCHCSRKCRTSESTRQLHRDLLANLHATLQLVAACQEICQALQYKRGGPAGARTAPTRSRARRSGPRQGPPRRPKAARA